MSFSEVLSRGFTAANRIPAGWLLFLLIVGVPQGVSITVGGLFEDAYQIEPGQPPSPQLIGMMAFGCGSLVWLLAAIFVTPWVTGGVLGQLRDQLSDPPTPRRNLADYGGRYYGRMLVLALIWVTLFLLTMIITGLVGMAIAATVIEPGQPIRQEQWQQMNWHPANIASAIVFFLTLTILGVIWSLAQAIVVLKDQGPLAALGEAFRFCKQHTGDVVKLLLVSTLLGLPLWLAGPVLAALDVTAIPIRAVIGLLVAAYFAYVIMLALGWGTSLYLSRRHGAAVEAMPAGATPADAPA